MSVYLYIILTALAYLVYRVMCPKGYHHVRHFNGPAHNVPFFGMFFDVVDKSNMLDLTKLLFKYHREYKSPVLMKAFGFYGCQIYKADQMELILKSKTNISKGYPVYNYLHPWLGLGLLTSTGEMWAHQRKILTPSFHFEILRQFLPIFDEHTRTFVRHIRKKLEENDGAAIDIRMPMSLSTLDIICETSMGKQMHALETDGTPNKYFMAVQRFAKVLPIRMNRQWLRSETIFDMTELGRQTKEDIAYMHTFTERVISEKERSGSFIDKTESLNDDGVDEFGSGKKRLALLDLLLDLKRRGVMTRKEVREQVDTFMFEGHDTTSNALIYIFYCLGKNAKYQQMVIDEIDAQFGVDDPLTWDKLNALPYLDRFIKEVQRLYPSVPIIIRHLDEDITLNDGSVLPKGMNTDLCIISLHRDADQFPDPLRFDPDRFLPSEIAKRHPFSFVPFSAGPRNCIGQKFALSELKAMTVQVLRNFTLHSTQTDDDLQSIMVMVLRAEAPVMIKFTPR